MQLAVRNSALKKHNIIETKTHGICAVPIVMHWNVSNGFHSSSLRNRLEQRGELSLQPYLTNEHPALFQNSSPVSG